MIKRYQSFYLHFFPLFCSNKTLWGSLKEPNIVNTNEFEDLFSKATLQPKKKPLSDTYEKKAKAKKVKHLGFNQTAPGWDAAVEEFTFHSMKPNIRLSALFTASHKNALFFPGKIGHEIKTEKRRRVVQSSAWCCWFQLCFCNT